MLQSLFKAIYPPQCVMCDAQTDVNFALCSACWLQTPFIDGLCCDSCGAPMMGDADGTAARCDDCIVTARPWTHGRCAMVYKDIARRLVLSLKHGDRTDLVRAAGPWLARAAGKMIEPETVLVPVPLHRFRLLRRKFNQSALLAHEVAGITGATCVPDALIRPKRTASLGRGTRDQRFIELQDAITIHPKRAGLIEGRKVVIVDDVMTSGATFAAATEALYRAGADDVCVLALARVVKDA